MVFQWKSSFNPGPSKQAQEIIFTCKIKKVLHPPIFFNGKLRMLKIRCSINFFGQTSSTNFITKRLGSDIRHIFNIDKHMKAVISKVSKTIGLLRKFDNCLPRSSLTTSSFRFGLTHLI